jgi:hypothetical protein
MRKQVNKKTLCGMMIVGLMTILFMMGCSENAPMSNSYDAWVPPPPLTAEHLATALPAGYRPVYCSVNNNGMAVESNDTYKEELIRVNHDKEVHLGDYKVKVWRECFHEDILLTMTIQDLTVMAIDFGPHPYQFDAPVRIKIKYHDHVPPGQARDSLATLYWNGYTQLYEDVSQENDTSHGEMMAWTDHFSRYVIATRCY